MDMDGGLRLRGRLEVVTRRRGAVIDRWTGGNMITDGALEKAVALFTGTGAQGGHVITSVAVGTSGAAAAGADTAITGPFVKAVAGFTFPAVGQVTTHWVIGTDEANGMAIMEFGLLAGDGTLLCRKVRAMPLHKSDDISVEGRWTWFFEGAEAPGGAVVGGGGIQGGGDALIDDARIAELEGRLA